MKKLCETGVDVAVVRLNDGFVVAVQGGCVAVVAAVVSKPPAAVPAVESKDRSSPL